MSQSISGANAQTQEGEQKPFSRPDLTPEEISLAVLALRESAAAGRIAATRLGTQGDKRAGAFLAKAARMDAVADRLNLALPA